MATTSARKAQRKFKFERRMGRVVMNPLVAALDKIGVRSQLVVELETTGAKSGHGRRAGWAHNIAANPKVRVRVDNQWRSGTATFEPDDDVRARARSFGGAGKLSQSATVLTMRAMESDPISVRIAFD
jgi:hypothetical protein